MLRLLGLRKTAAVHVALSPPLSLASCAQLLRKLEQPTAEKLDSLRTRLRRQSQTGS